MVEEVRNAAEKAILPFLVCWKVQTVIQEEVPADVLIDVRVPCDQV